MGSLGDDDNELTPIKKNPNVNIAYTETQPFDSQFSPPSSSGEKVKDGNDDELQLMQSTVPYCDTVPLEEDVFQTQLVNLGGETQVLDDPDCSENLCTQLIYGFDDEVILDSDGEASDKTDVLSDAEGLSDGDSVRRVDGRSLDEEKMESTVPCEHGEKGLMEESNALTVEQCSSEFRVSLATPLDQGTPASKPGSVRRGFTSVRAASLRASGLAARSRSFKGTNNGSCCIQNNIQSSKQPAVEDNGISFTRDSSKAGEEVDRVPDWGKQNEEVKELRNESRCRVGRSTVRKLFSEDTLAENKDYMSDINNADGDADLPHLPSYGNELAGLSYVDSQEPGEFSQANALDFVDRFLKVNVVEFSQEADPGKITRGESILVTSAKGSLSLAKKSNLRSTIGEAGIYDWDDSREDEGGGAFFDKKKEEFFDGRGRGQRSFIQPRKSKGSKVDKFKDGEEQSNIHDKIMGAAHSDSRLVLHNIEENGKIAQAAEMKIKKNLSNELEEQLKVNSSGQLEAVVTNTDMPDMLNVGVDTQMAAEAMEALLYGEPLANDDANDARQGGQNITKGSCTGSSREEMRDRVPPKQYSFSKRAYPSDSGIATRQSKKTKRIGAKIGKAPTLSPQKHSRNLRKQFDAGLVKAKPNRAKSNVEEHYATNGIQNPDKMPSKISEQRQEKGTLEESHINDCDKFHATAKSSGCSTVKKRRLQEAIGTNTPIAQRTRQCMVLHEIEGPENASNDSRGEMNCLMEIGAPKGKRKRRGTGMGASKVLSDKQKIPKLVSNQSGEVENVQPCHDEQSDPKLAAKIGGARMDALSYPRGRRTCRNLLGQVNGSGNLDGPSKRSVGKQAIGHSITRMTRSKSSAPSTCADLDIRKTRSSTYACPVLSSSGRKLEGRFSRQSSDKQGLGDAVLNSDSADMNGKMIYKDQMGAEASKHSDRESDAGPTSSAEGTDGNARLLVSPSEINKSSKSACTTPVNCTTPINDASPVCMGNEYFKQSCKKNLSRSCLVKEISNFIATVPESTSFFKDTRRRRDMANVRVLFSHHLDEDIIKHQKKILSRLGASIASSISDATHFITDKFVRTRNMLEAIAFGKPVVTHLWLESCNQTSCLIDEKNYILRDAKKEKEFGFSMPVSLARACQRPLLQSQRVLITPNTKPGKELIAGLVKAVHGQAVERIGRSVLKDDKIPDDLLVLSCEEDYEICVPFLEKGAAVYSSELLLNGIVVQKLEYERYRLFEDNVKRTRSTIWLKKKDGSQFLPVTSRQK